MDTSALYSQIESLPDSLKVVVEHFVQHLVAAEKQVKITIPKKKRTKIDSEKVMFAVPSSTSLGKPIDSVKYPFKPGFGGAKGLIHLSPDWDEPLEDLTIVSRDLNFPLYGVPILW